MAFLEDKNSSQVDSKSKSTSQNPARKDTQQFDSKFDQVEEGVTRRVIVKPTETEKYSTLSRTNPAELLGDKQKISTLKKITNGTYLNTTISSSASSNTEKKSKPDVKNAKSNKHRKRLGKFMFY